MNPKERKKGSQVVIYLRSGSSSTGKYCRGFQCLPERIMVVLSL